MKMEKKKTSTPICTQVIMHTKLVTQGFKLLSVLTDVLDLKCCTVLKKSVVAKGKDLLANFHPPK